MAAAWILARPNGSTKEDALEWLRHQNVSQALSRKLWPVLESLWAQGYALGLEAAIKASGFSGEIDGQTLLDLINNYGPRWLQQIVSTLLKRIAGVLADSAGLTADVLAAGITAVLADDAHAKRIAQTEITRAVGEATVKIYRAAGVPEVIWVTDPASDVCAQCDANEAAGPRFLGTPFPSGAIAPPQHVRCRCALMPYRRS